MANFELTDNEMSEIFDSFIIESYELLEKISDDLIVLESDRENFDLINQLFRSFHTIKGTSSFMGFAQIASITHTAEDLLNKMRKGDLKASMQIIDALLEARDWISFAIDNISRDRTANIDDSPIHTDALVKKLQILANPTLADKTTSEDQSNEPEVQKIEFSNAVEAVLGNPNFGTGEGDFTPEEIALLDQAFSEVNSTFQQKIAESKPDEKLKEKIRQIDGAPSREEKNDEAKATKHLKGVETSIRVDVARVESLMNLSGELVLGRNRLSQITEKISAELETSNTLAHLLETVALIDFVTSEIQTAVMKMRMAPIAKLFQKAPRIVRDLSKEFGKEIQLVLRGEETELDRGIIEDLNDPLVHMIRNSCDHGIESPEERAKKGKTRIGTITLSAEQEGNTIIMKIIDDGAGMDPEKLKEKAIEKGVITKEQATVMTTREAFQLIFMPGFSTAKVVTSVSGRGVGMDVVRSNIMKLKGAVEIDSEIGVGSTFIIKLPLTLAIIQGLLVKSGQEVYALPLSSVLEVVSLDDEILSTINKREVVQIRDQVLPLLRLGEALNIPTSVGEAKYVVTVALAHYRVGIAVDELLGQQEIVIKSLGNYLGRVQGIAGSTILGDGSVIMIIDLADLIHLIEPENNRAQA